MALILGGLHDIEHRILLRHGGDRARDDVEELYVGKWVQRHPIAKFVNVHLAYLRL